MAQSRVVFLLSISNSKSASSDVDVGALDEVAPLVDDVAFILGAHAHCLVAKGGANVGHGRQSETWDGRDSSGTKWPDGNYTISITGKDASGQSVAIPSEVQGVVDSADLTKTPPVLTIGGQNFTLDKVKRVVRPGA